MHYCERKSYPKPRRKLALPTGRVSPQVRSKFAQVRRKFAQIRGPFAHEIARNRTKTHSNEIPCKCSRHPGIEVFSRQESIVIMAPLEKSVKRAPSILTGLQWTFYNTQESYNELRRDGGKCAWQSE